MKTLSICMIVKNEEELLARCLNSVKDLVDEIVIVDSGSTDKTLQIAKSFGAKIFYFEWCNDFSKARNFAFSKATSDYILWLDADDVMPKPTLQYLVKNKKKLTIITSLLTLNLSRLFSLKFICSKTSCTFVPNSINSVSSLVIICKLSFE